MNARINEELDKKIDDLLSTAKKYYRKFFP